MDLIIQDGLAETAFWIGGNLSTSLSHVIQMIRNGHAIAQTFSENVYFALDRYFLTVPLLMELKELNESAAYCLDIITRAKANCTAYAKPEKKSGPHRGRPRKKGKSFKVMDLFESRKHDFIAPTIFMYDREQKVEYLSFNLLWGIKLYQELQFVLVKYDHVTSILATTDLDLAPTLVIEAYAHRFKIEQIFHEMKQQIRGFSYHFWNSKVPKLNKYKKKSDPDPLTLICEEDRPSVLSAIEVIERFVLCSEISMGIIHMTALNSAFVEMIERHRYLWTSHKGKVSEAIVIDYLRNIFSTFVSEPPFTHKSINSQHARTGF